MVICRLAGGSNELKRRRKELGFIMPALRIDIAIRTRLLLAGVIDRLPIRSRRFYRHPDGRYAMWQDMDDGRKQLYFQRSLNSRDVHIAQQLITRFRQTMSADGRGDPDDGRRLERWCRRKGLYNPLLWDCYPDGVRRPRLRSISDAEVRWF